MNMFKKNGGFTLVELIVVIAILAILAVVAVPAYSGYIQKANNTACLSELTAVQTAAQSACALEGSTVSSISINKTSGDVTVTAASAAVDAAKVEENFNEFYTTAANKLVEVLEKHEDFEGLTSVDWTVADGWNLLEGESATEAPNT